MAKIVGLVREDAKLLIDGHWWNTLGPTLSDPRDQLDRHWKWRELVSTYQNHPFFQARCIKSPDGAIQGALTLRVDAKSALETGERAVFVGRLASAPRNRAELVAEPDFRGAGTGLLIYAIALSYTLGFSGRVNLFPVTHEAFYADLGFVPTVVIEQDDTLLELPAATALLILQQRGLLDV